MKKQVTYIMLIVLTLLGASCERLPLYDEDSNVYLDIDIDLDIENEDALELPKTMIAAFFDSDMHSLSATQYTVPTGGEVFIEPGSYHLLVYNFNSGTTHLRNEHSYDEIEAYTNDVRPDERRRFESIKKAILQQARAGRGYFDEPIVYEPEHLYTSTVEDTNIPVRYDGDDKYVIHADASTILETYSVKISNIVNPEWIGSATIYITDQVPSRIVSSRGVTGEPSTIYFTAYEAESRNEVKDGVLTTKFRTFGRWPDYSRHVYLILDIANTGGGHTAWEWDISDQMQGTNRHIVIEDNIEVPDPQTGHGGFAPTVNPWDETIYDIEI